MIRFIFAGTDNNHFYQKVNNWGRNDFLSDDFSFTKKLSKNEE